MAYLSIVIIVIIFFILLNFAYAGFSAAPWVPSRKKDFKRILELADVQAGDVVYDLGSGDGRWLFYFASNSSAKEIKGFEISLIMFIISWIRKLFRGYPHVKILLKNFYRADLSKADVVICFLTPPAMKKLFPKLKKEMKKEARLISYAFKIIDLNPEKVSKVSQKDIPLYLYRF